VTLVVEPKDVPLSGRLAILTDAFLRWDERKNYDVPWLRRCTKGFPSRIEA
jgi:hypothetical protein